MAMKSICLIAVIAIGNCCSVKAPPKKITLDINRSCGIKPSIDSKQILDVRDSIYSTDRFFNALLKLAVLTNNIYFPSANYKIYKASTSQYAIAGIELVNNSPMIIAYDAERMEDLRKQTGTTWIYEAIAAHEYTHHYLNHFYRSLTMNPRNRELAADTAIGYFLNRMGTPSLDSAQALMNIIASEKSEGGYPTRSERMAAIRAGWAKADIAIFQSKILAITSLGDNPAFDNLAIVTDQLKHESIKADIPKLFKQSDSVFKVEIPRMKNSSFYILNNKLYYMATNEGLTYTLGTVCESALAQFKYMVYDDFYQALYIDKNGKIIDASGHTLGNIRSDN